MKRRAKNTSNGSPLEEEAPAWVDDPSAPVKERVRSWNAWMDTYYHPHVKRLAEHEARTGIVIPNSLEVPDAPFDYDSV